jgi:hypothetical protein
MNLFQRMLRAMSIERGTPFRFAADAVAAAAGAPIVCRRRLTPRQPRVLPVHSRQTIVCESGTVWVTQGGSQDHVLTPGQEVSLAPTDTVLITAMAGPARIHCRAPSDAPPSNGRAAAAMDADRTIAPPESSAWRGPDQPPHPYLNIASCGSLT